MPTTHESRFPDRPLNFREDPETNPAHTETSLSFKGKSGIPCRTARKDKLEGVAVEGNVGHHLHVVVRREHQLARFIDRPVSRKHLTIGGPFEVPSETTRRSEGEGDGFGYQLPPQ